MKLLLDSHIVLWLIYEPERLPATLLQTLRQSTTQRLLSDVTLLELTLKLSKGKLEYSNDLTSFMHHIEDLASDPLPISREHILTSVSLPRLHGNPFDRLLIAQAKVENATLVTDDGNILKYQVTTLSSV